MVLGRTQSFCLALLPSSDLIEHGLFSRVADRLRHDALQRSNLRRRRRFPRHDSLLVCKHSKWMLRLQCLATAPCGKVDLEAVLSDFGKHTFANFHVEREQFVFL